jgi:hypothetical protein
MGIKRWGLTLLGLIGAVCLLTTPLGWPIKSALAYAWLASPLIFCPFVPWTIRFRIGPPINPEDLFGSDDLDEAYVRVEAAVQDLLNRAGADPPLPP